jgi:hypothetical protein
MNRRSILAMFTGGAASAMSGMSVKEAAARVGALPASEDNLLQAGISVGPKFTPAHKVLRMLWRERDEKYHAQGPMPPHIANKKSWSAVFKRREHLREIRELNELIERIENDHVFADQVAKFMGIE